MNIIGISSFYHDSAACLIKKGDINSAAQEERFTRIKHDSSFPINSIKFCIKSGKIKPSEIDYIVFYEKPFLKFERLIETYLAFAPKGFKSFSASIPLWVKNKIFQKKKICDLLDKNIDDSIDWSKKLLFSEHHLSHAASAFYPSPFNEAAILTMDGVGEWPSTSIASGLNNKLYIKKEINFPHSLGLLYSAFTFFCGFKVNSGEYKLMGLAPYGEPLYKNIIKDNLVDIKDDGSFQLNLEYFDYCTGFKMTNKKFNYLFGRENRTSESQITKNDMDIAASIQKVTEEIVIKICKNIKKETSQKNLCLAGGVALNCVANGKLLEEEIFENIWIQPAAGDAGGALGAALSVYYDGLNSKRKVEGSDSMKGSYLGPNYEEKDIEEILIKNKINYNKLSKTEIIKKTAKLLSEEKAIGWMNGKMEFGPMALGNRSIIADPRSPLMQQKLNLKIKFRESFRPFAPTVIEEEVSEWFDLKTNSPYMLLVSNVKKNKQNKVNIHEENKVGFEKLKINRSLIPAVTHVDFSARVQTVNINTNPDYYNLIKEFNDITGVPIIVNTSFNIRGEPIVCSPEDALRCFLGTDLDVLIIENFLIKKQDQKNLLDLNYKNKYELD